MNRYEVRKTRRSQIAGFLQSSENQHDLLARAMNMPKHLFGTFILDVEMYIVSENPFEITAGGDQDFFSDNHWFYNFNMQDVYDLLRKESML